ncbi:SDR family NAD(P)-dependent oxidoreductase [Pinisolibacter sp.]|uniref:SDR family NAD(P)-dependent oxidoreductase n=1 Tax=Pinisolibacter sp. TaxID=2172024 RepID=UPI002FDD55EB
MTSSTSTPGTALITGASSGIGRALADRFAADGWNVVLAARSVAKLEALAAELAARHGVTATAIGADLAGVDGAHALHAEVERRGIAVDALVANAGSGTYGDIRDGDLAKDVAMIQLNTIAVVALVRLFLPTLLARRGKILVTASTAAFQPCPHMAIYGATKAFVLSYCEALAEELSGTGVTVTALCPGATATGFFDAADMNGSALVKGKRLPTSESVAAVGYRAMVRGRRIAIPGLLNLLLAQSVRFTPRRVVTLVGAAMLRRV